MNSIFKKSLLIFLLASFAGNKAYHYDRQINDKNVIIATAGVAILVVGAIGIAKYFGWFDEKNENLLNRADHELKTAIMQFSPVIKLIDDTYQIKFRNAHEKANLVNEIHELLLAGLHPMLELVHPKTDMAIEIFNNRQHALKSVKKDLDRRILKLRKNLEYKDNKYFYDRMVQLSQQIEDYLIYLEFTSKFLSNHISYFELTNSYADYFNKYQRELSLLKGSFNGPTLGYELKRCALIRFNDASYPFLEFEKELKKDIFEFANKIRRSRYNYQQLLYIANVILADLQKVHEYIITDPDYLQEKVRRENDLREQERIAIAQREATAREREAKAREEAAKAKWQQAQAAMAHNQILATQPQQQQVVNVNNYNR
ncbi:hypothetical protein A3F66_04160 [candidate division TM6 bacterium RIFCSPHIGHO2_12_FULL_32_22]|nr:MAG: hypothetical protein A3F66_04160 [candidate division TM6 bacterium RIFCSPHIGHO2_12_FULL_32_22]